MQKVIIIGCPGAGKSTFARKLRDSTNLPLYHLDMLWHKPDQTTISREIFETKLQEIIEKDQWIIDGNYLSTMELRMQACDTIFLLDIPMEICLKGAASRIGKQREDMPWMESEFDEEFRQWILDFPTGQLPYIQKLLKKYSDKDIHRFHSREEAEVYLRCIKEETTS